MLKRAKFLLSASNRKVLLNFNSNEVRYKATAVQGYDTGIRISCRKTKQKIPLILSNKSFVKWYICGPTVYDVCHVGHASCYIRFDIINRILKNFFDISPIVALGVTDIDDKIIKKALRKKVYFREIAKQYELEFFDQLNTLNVLPPSFVLRVSDHIPEIISFVSKIIDKGDAYSTEDGSVYFISRDSDEESEPSKFQHNLKPGQRSHSDFALWKGVKPDEPNWESPWGKGRPGWHTECSAMASKIFGSQLDLHGGGIDLQFPHHVCEEKQSCSYHGCSQWVDYWIYAGELEIEEEKMSKSLNNFISISDFLKSYTPDNLRMFCFVSGYFKGLHYTNESVLFAANECNSISKFLGDAASYVKGNWTLGNVSESSLLQQLEETKTKVREHLMDDFNTSQCHIVLMKLIRNSMTMLCESPEVSSSRSPAVVSAVSQYVSDFYRSMGFKLGSEEAVQVFKNDQQLEFLIDQVAEFRNQVRAEAFKCEHASVKGNLLKACDSLRDNFKIGGVVFKDVSKDKSSWSFYSQQDASKAAA